MSNCDESTPLLASRTLSDGSCQYYRSDIQPEDENNMMCESQKTGQYLSDIQSMMHLLKASIAIGILGLPKALMNAGIVVGPLLLLLIAVITLHCVHLLVSCANRLSINIFVNTLLCATQFGVCTAYVLFIAENLHDGMAELDVVHIKTKLYIPIIMPFLILFCLIRDLKSLAWLSWFANVMMVIVLISIYQYLYGHVQDPSELKFFSNWGDLPLFFGTSVYAFEAIPIILPLKDKTRNPSHFSRILNIGMAIVTLLYLNMAIFGYMTFQDVCKGSVTLNLPNTKYYSTIKFLVSLAIFCTYYIQIFVFFHILEPIICSRIAGKYHKCSLVLFRIATVCLTCGTAAAVPHLNDIVSLVGATGVSLLAFTCPTVFHWIVFSNETSRLMAAKNIFIIIFALIGCLTGTFASIRNMIQNK